MGKKKVEIIIDRFDIISKIRPKWTRDMRTQVIKSKKRKDRKRVKQDFLKELREQGVI